jgi:hypothetical protein
MKACKNIPQLTLTEDDAKLVAEKVQDHTTEALYDAEKQREEIVKKLTNAKDALGKLQIITTQQKIKHKSNKSLRKEYL